MSIKRVLVTGGAGFIGSHLVERLLAEGLEVTVLDDFSTGSTKNLASVEGAVGVIRGSILDASAIGEAARGAKCVFHLAAIVSVPRSVQEPLLVDEVNCRGTLMALEASRREGAKFVFSSSAAVYGDSPELPKTEAMAPEPVSPYGAQKLAGEAYVRAYAASFGMEACSLRYFNVYGPRQDPTSPYSGVITKFLRSALAGEDLTIFGDGSQTRDFVYVQDVVEANILAMRARTCGEAFNVGTGASVDIERLAGEIAQEAGQGSIVRHAAPRAGDIEHSRCDPSRAARDLGFRAKVGIEEGIARTLEYFRSG